MPTPSAHHQLNKIIVIIITSASQHCEVQGGSHEGLAWLTAVRSQVGCQAGACSLSAYTTSSAPHPRFRPSKQTASA